MVTRNELAQSIGYRENGAYSQTLKLVKQDLTHNDMKYEKEFLDLLAFNDSRFTIDPSKEARAFNVRLHHENEDVYLRCQFTLNDTYSYVDSLGANITYIGIEENILRLLEKFGKSKVPKKFRRDHASTFVYLFPEYYPYPSQPYYFPHEEINRVKDIIRMAEKCNQFWSDSAKPFFDKFQDFRNILPYIESFDVQEYSKFIEPGSCTERKLILWRLCNHPKLDEFYDYSIDELNSLQAINPNPDIARRILILKECGLLLKRIEPMYDWDQNYLIPKT